MHELADLDAHVGSILSGNDALSAPERQHRDTPGRGHRRRRLSGGGVGGFRRRGRGEHVSRKRDARVIGQNARSTVEILLRFLELALAHGGVCKRDIANHDDLETAQRILVAGLHRQHLLVALERIAARR